ncbi:MAG: hypothetical protein WBP59_16570 [Ilumatobacteraceae bacterium]
MIAVLTAGARPMILAHQGGWDEILLIGGPILLIAALLMLAKKRVDAAAATLDDTSDQPNSPS